MYVRCVHMVYLLCRCVRYVCTLCMRVHSVRYLCMRVVYNFYVMYVCLRALALMDLSVMRASIYVRVCCVMYVCYARNVDHVCK